MFRRRRFFQGRPIHGTDIGDIAWFRPDGTLMSDDDWRVSFAKTLGVFLNGDALAVARPARPSGAKRQLLHDLQRARRDTIDFTLPGERWGKQWSHILDTAP